MLDNFFAPLCVISAGVMSRETHGYETRSGSDGSAAYRGGTAAQAQGAAGRGGTTHGRVAAGGEQLGAAVGGGQGCGGQAQDQALGSAQATGRCPMRGPEPALAQGRVGRRIPHGTLDRQTGAHAHQTRVRRGVQQHRRLGVAAQPGLHPAETGKARAAARRAGHRPVEAQDLACAQKKPAEKDAPSSS